MLVSMLLRLRKRMSIEHNIPIYGCDEFPRGLNNLPVGIWVPVAHRDAAVVWWCLVMNDADGNVREEQTFIQPTHRPPPQNNYAAFARSSSAWGHRAAKDRIANSSGTLPEISSHWACSL
jgi:hypothetical protein